MDEEEQIRCGEGCRGEGRGVEIRFAFGGARAKKIQLGNNQEKIANK